MMAEAKVHTYKLNRDTGYYDLVNGVLGFSKLPEELRVEETVRTDQIRSKLICRGRIRNGKYTFFTGLIAIGSGGLHFGDHYEVTNGVKKNSFILFHFTENNENLTIHFFNHFKVYPKQRAGFVSRYFNSNK